MASLIEELADKNVCFEYSLYLNPKAEIFPFYIKGVDGVGRYFNSIDNTLFSYNRAIKSIRRYTFTYGSFIYKNITYNWLNNIIYNKKEKQLVMFLDKRNRKTYVQFGYLFTSSFLYNIGPSNEIIYVENLSKLLRPIIRTKELSKLKILEKDLLNKIKTNYEEWS